MASARAPHFPPLVVVFCVAVGAAAGVFASVAGATMAAAVAAGALVAVGAALVVTRRERRRRRIARAPFPPAWRSILEERVAYYQSLAAPERRRFESEVAVFLNEQRVNGPRGAPLEDDLRVLVAASAVALAFGRPGYRYPTTRDVVVYDDAFGDDYEVDAGGPILGMVHSQGPILFSAKALRAGFRGAHDGRNVGYHELAHVIDFDGGPADGVPALMPLARIAPWTRVMAEESRQLRRRLKGRRKSVLRPYALTNEAEFFAVATEVFFEQPKRLAAEHPELYDLLRETYRQDPAA
ncbi:MAG: zinc-dependent peptidase [Myxococcota bacterium]